MHSCCNVPFASAKLFILSSSNFSLRQLNVKVLQYKQHRHLVNTENSTRRSRCKFNCPVLRDIEVHNVGLDSIFHSRNTSLQYKHYSSPSFTVQRATRILTRNCSKCKPMFLIRVLLHVTEEDFCIDQGPLLSEPASIKANKDSIEPINSQCF